MPVTSFQIPNGARVLLFLCACGRDAMYGEHCDILAALRTGDVSKAGVWRCPECQRKHEQEEKAA